MPYLRQAGENAGKYHANDEAIEYLSQAGEILEDIALDLSGDALRANLAEQFKLVSQQRIIFDVMGEREREFDTLNKLLDLAEKLKDTERWVAVMCRLSTHFWHVGKLQEAEDVARKALDVAKKNKNQRGEQFALERVARVLWTKRNVEAMEWATQSLALARQFNDRIREGRLLELIAHIYGETLHDPERAAIHFNHALEICRDGRQ